MSVEPVGHGSLFVCDVLLIHIIIATHIQASATAQTPEEFELHIVVPTEVSLYALIHFAYVLHVINNFAEIFNGYSQEQRKSLPKPATKSNPHDIYASLKKVNTCIGVYKHAAFFSRNIYYCNRYKNLQTSQLGHIFLKVKHFGSQHLILNTFITSWLIRNIGKFLDITFSKIN